MKLLHGKREQNKLENRNAILAAGYDCFVGAGYESITVRDIIRKSGLGAGTFYNYFPDKKSVFRALVGSRLIELHERIHQARVSARSIESFIYEAYLVGFDAVKEDPAFYALLFRNEAVAHIFYQENILVPLMNTLSDDIRAAMARGMIPEMSVDMLAAMIYGSGRSLSRLITAQPQLETAVLAEFATRLLVDGLGNAPATPKMIRIGPKTLGGAAR